MTSLKDLHAANIARQAEWCPDQVPDLSFRGNELGGECGEAQNVIKKLERERLGWRGSRATKEQLAEELADVVICADLCAVTAGIDLGAAVVAKFNATSDRYELATKLAEPVEVDIAKAIRDAWGQGRAYGMGQQHAQQREIIDSARDAWIRQYMARLPVAAPVAPSQGSAEIERLERVRHLKRGTEYEVLGEATAAVSESTTDERGTLPNSTVLIKGHCLVVYRCAETGRLFCRRNTEFRDGRFVTIEPGARHG